MTSLRLLKILTIVALVAGAAAAIIWYQSGEPASPWLTRLAFVAFFGALLTGLVGRETRPRLMLRFLAALFALLAVIAFAADFANAPASNSWISYSLLEHLQNFAPSLVASLKSQLTRAFGEWAWSPLMTGLLGLPAYLLFAAMALICGYAGRPRRRVQIFVN
jgi:uncharacterized membrane protein YfcA